jgi:hypothetical protein
MGWPGAVARREALPRAEVNQRPADDWAPTKPRRPRCGARCRSRGGAPCRAPAVWDQRRNAPRNGRCRLHGGLSTGARTEAGRARLHDAGCRGAQERWRRWRASRSAQVDQSGPASGPA